jgi:23S rRNA (guanosine2251-2'-O)-methyltransferase
VTKLNARQLRTSKPKKADTKKRKFTPIYLVLDQIIDTYNIGSLFRLADAVAVKKMYLCGDMEYPPSSRIHKAAVGTENWVPWEKRDSTVEVIRELKKSPGWIPSDPTGPREMSEGLSHGGVQIIVVEQHPNSISYADLTKKLNSLQRGRQGQFYVAIVVGNETHGVSKEVLKLADIIVELPMLGINKSFNVWGSAAVICYKVLENLK